jgi:predicted AAA+ superfamily ATPase
VNERTLDVEEPKTAQREIAGLESAMEEFRLKEGLVITLNESGVLEKPAGMISVVPLYEWLLP